MVNPGPGLQQVPEDLRRLPHWVLWRSEDRDGKATKVPIDPKTGTHAKVNQPVTWGGFAQAKRALPRYRCNGIGFVLTEGDPYTVIDLDNAIDTESGELKPWAHEIVNTLKSYSEISPSRAGIHIFVRAKLPEGAGHRVSIEDGHFEVYDQSRYMTVTGDVITESVGIEDRQPEIEELLVRLSLFEAVPQEDPSPAPAAENLPLARALELVQEACRNDVIFDRLWKGDATLWEGDSPIYPSQSEADLALSSLIADRINNAPGTVDRLFRESGLMRPKWDEIHDSSGKRTYGQMTVTKAVEGYRKGTQAGIPSPGGADGGHHIPQRGDSTVGDRESTKGKTITAVELLRKNLPAPFCPVRGLLAEGVTILAALPKRGKTWLALNIALGVAEGKPIIGGYETCKADVLYLALDDSERRFQDRLTKLLGGEPPPEGLRFAFEWPLVKDGGLDELEREFQANPNLRLVIIDILARIKDSDRTGGGVYQMEHDFIKPIKALAYKHHVAIMLVHHLSKGEFGDSILKISGSTGLSGAVDASWVLESGTIGDCTDLVIDSKDVQSDELTLEFDQETGMWTVVGESAALRGSEARRGIIDALQDGQKTLGQLREIVNTVSPNQVTKLLSAMTREGYVVRRSRGVYALPDEKEQTGDTGNQENCGEDGEMGDKGETEEEGDEEDGGDSGN